MALLPNAGFLNPDGGLPDISWVTVAENNDPSLGGSPITLHIVQVDRRERYRGAIKTVASDNVFDENLGLRHQGDFGANPDDLYFEWWYRPDDGSLNVPPPDLLKPGQPNPWKLFPDPTGRRGQGRYQITLKGNPNAPEALLADTWWFVRYRHANDDTQDTNWRVPQTPRGDPAVAKKKADRTRYINEFCGVLVKKLAEAGLDADVSGRPKHFYSIYQKMQRENLLTVRNTGSRESRSEPVTGRACGRSPRERP